MPFSIAHPFDPAEILPIWELESNDTNLYKGYDDEDDDDDQDITDEDERRIRA